MISSLQMLNQELLQMGKWTLFFHHPMLCLCGVDVAACKDILHA